MMRLVLAALLAVLASGVQAKPVQVTSGDHPGFTRLVVQYAAPVNWVMGRTPDGYEVRLPDGAVQYDLSAVFDQIGKSRLAAIWADPDSGALHVGVACACYAMPFEFRPGIIVIDLHDGAPPAGSSFEQPLDGGTSGDLAARPILRPKPRPGQKMAAADPVTPYDWTALALDETRPQTSGPRTTAGVVPSTDPGLEPLRQSLMAQLSLGASQGIVDMILPKAQTAATTEGDPSVNIHLGETANLVIRQKGEGGAALTALGALCIADDRLDIGSWADDSPVADQFGPSRSALTGEFDRPDAEAVKMAVQFTLNLGFGAEARALLRVFPGEQPDAVLWASMAHILDEESDPAPAFAGMSACDTAAALWAVLADPDVPPGNDIQKAAILRGFSALPGHLRRQLGPRLVGHFLKVGDFSTAVSLRDAILRAPGDAGPDVELMQAAMEAAIGKPGAAQTRLEPLTTAPGPAQPDALVALVEQRASLAQDVSFAQVQALEELLKERRGGAEEPRFQRALVLAYGASGDFEAAFAGLAKAPDATAGLWNILAKTGSDTALLAHATIALDAPLPPQAKPVATLIAARMLQFGLSDQAARWLGLDDHPPSVLMARVALAQGNPQAALATLAGDETAQALPVRAEALRQLGDEQAAAKIYASLGKDDERWNAIGRAHDWIALASDGPEPWKGAAAALASPVADTLATSSPTIAAPGPLAQSQSLLTQSAATRSAITALLTAVKSPAIATQ